WTAPIPTYVEQCLLPLYLAAAVAGYWGAGRFVVAAFLAAVGPMRELSFHSNIERLKLFALAGIQRVRIGAIHLGIPKLTLCLAPAARLIRANPGQALSQRACEGARISPRWENAFRKSGSLALPVAMVIVGLVPAWFANFAVNRSAPYA